MRKRHLVIFQSFLSLMLVTSLMAPAKHLLASEASDPVEVAGMQRHEGFFNFYFDDSEAKIWLVLPDTPREFIYVTSLTSGLGSNPVGLDRGQFGDSRIARFKRVGSRVYLIKRNTKFRASANDAAQRKAVSDSFAPSILWSGETRQSSEQETLVDITPLLLTDAHGCVETLSASGQGSYSLAGDLSFIHAPRCKAFPKNVELEATLTFTNRSPGALASATAADGKSVSLRQHHSFVALPDAGYRPRKWDPRVGAFSVEYADYSAGIEESLTKRLITRHRLQKENPAAESRAVQPIVYYVDAGVPEPVRQALIDGASWWNEAFEAAGFVDAFQVRVLPEDVDPMDVRYNVIQWVHRATRGWSYGQSVVDPRTGEILKGHVLLGSLRVRQDHQIFEGLSPNLHSSNSLGIAPMFRSANSPQGRSGRNSARLSVVDDECSAAAPAFPALLAGEDAVELSLARIRQLSAHEVGHTLGFAHNFAASTYGGRASVMDYPAPLIQVADGNLDFSDAYDVGIGSWDKFAVQYAYTPFADDDEPAQLKRLLKQAAASGHRYLSDADARPAGAAQPLANLWDNGADPVSGLRQTIAVRKIAIEQFGVSALRPGQSLAELEPAFAPIYLLHRYQVEASAKMLGGQVYWYRVNDDVDAAALSDAIKTIDERQQKLALEALLGTLEPEFLQIPDRIVKMLNPGPLSRAARRESFEGRTDPTFDPSAAYCAAADLTLGAILQPERVTRLAQDSQSDWGLVELLDELTERLVAPDVEDNHPSAQRAVLTVFVRRLLELARSNEISSEAAAVVHWKLRVVKDAMRWNREDDPVTTATGTLLRDEIEAFFEAPAPTIIEPKSLPLPPGSPIGGR